MESTRIKVTTIDYYHRDQNMKVTCGLTPTTLNKNRKFFEKRTRRVPKVPNINLNIEVADSGAGEYQMESLFEYIRQKGWPNGQKPDFVTNKQLLKFIASDGYDSMSVKVVRFDGVIFMLKSSECYSHWASFGAVFEHFMTKKSRDEEIREKSVVEKAVFVAEIPMENEKIPMKNSFKVMYSGEIDAVDESNQHYELKTLLEGPNEYFWTNRSCVCYWQCILSNVPLMVVGSRSGKYPYCALTRKPKNIPEYSLYEIESIQVSTMPQRAAHEVNLLKIAQKRLPKNAEWTVENGEKRIENFLKMVSAKLRDNKDCFQFSKSRKNSKWNTVPIEWESSEFCRQVVDSVSFLNAWKPADEF